MKLLRLSVLLFVLSMMVSCLPDQESDYEKIVERDNRLVKDFLDRNSINAIENSLGFFYQKVESNEMGSQIVNNDILGVYYEIKTIDGQLIDSHLDERKAPKLFRHNDGGLVPRVINFASGIAKEGETLIIYSPSYLAYQQYSFEQLIAESSNLVIKVKYAKIFVDSDVIALEKQMMEQFIEENQLSGFVLTEEGFFIKIDGEPAADAKAAANEDVVVFDFELRQMGESDFISRSNENLPIQARVGNDGNLTFLNLALLGVKAGQEIEVFAPSRLAFGITPQIFPSIIRRDLFSKGAINSLARPFEPIYFKASIKEVR